MQVIEAGCMAHIQNKGLRPIRNTRPYSNGVTLVEVLVAVVLLSVGLLGIAGLQAGVAKYKINTYARSSISSLYADLADRIRINSDVAGTNLFTGVASTSQYLLSGTWSTQQSATLSDPSPNCLTTACTTSQRASYDMVVWRQRVRNTLPQGAALVSGNLSTGIDLTLMWNDKEFTDKGSASDSALVSAPTCTGSETGMARQSCCPAAASAPAGVRCARFLFTP